MWSNMNHWQTWQTSILPQVKRQTLTQMLLATCQYEGCMVWASPPMCFCCLWKLNMVKPKLTRKVLLVGQLSMELTTHLGQPKVQYWTGGQYLLCLTIGHISHSFTAHVFEMVTRYVPLVICAYLPSQQKKDAIFSLSSKQIDVAICSGNVWLFLTPQR